MARAKEVVNLPIFIVELLYEIHLIRFSANQLRQHWSPAYLWELDALVTDGTRRTRHRRNTSHSSQTEHVALRFFENWRKTGRSQFIMWRLMRCSLTAQLSTTLKISTERSLAPIMDFSRLASTKTFDYRIRLRATPRATTTHTCPHTY